MQFTEWKYGTRGTGVSGLQQPGYQQYTGNVQYHKNVYQYNNPNQGKYKFGTLTDQAQQNCGYERCDSNQIIPSHATATRQTELNRVTKFIPPLKQDQNASPMSNCNSNKLVPIFQSTNGYNGRGKMSNRSHYLQSLSDPPANQYNSSLVVPPLPNASRNDLSERHTSNKSATGLQESGSSSQRRFHHHVTNEIVNKTQQLQESSINCRMYENSSTTDRQPSTPLRSRPVSSVPKEMETESMLQLVPDDTQCTAVITNFNCKIFGSTVGEKIFVFTGSVEKVMKWNKIFRNHFCFFEVIASIVSIQEGSVKTQKVMLLRDKKGPVLQVVYYLSTHLDLRDFYIGQMIRCIGRMSGQNVLNAESIRCASPEEVDNLQRLCLVCDQAVSHYLNV